MFQKIRPLIFHFSFDKKWIKTPNTITTGKRGSHLVEMLLYCLAIEQTHETWNRPLSDPMKHCLNLFSLYVISILMHSLAQSTRVHLIFSKYCEYGRLCTHVRQKNILGTHGYLLRLTVARMWGVRRGSKMTGTAEVEKEAGQVCLQWQPPGVHTCPSNQEQNLIKNKIIFVSHNFFLSVDE